MIIHVVADSDSRWKWGASLAARLLDDGAPTQPEAPEPAEFELAEPVLAGPVLVDREIAEHHALAEHNVFGHLVFGRATPTQQQVDDVGVDAYPVRRVRLGAVVTDPALAEADVVILACTGGNIQSALRGFAHAWANRPSRPCVVTGYVGLVFQRFVDGLLLRVGADVVLANSANDAAAFRGVYAAIGAESDAVVQTALPFLDGTPYDRRLAERGQRPFTVCFVTQPTVPLRRNERRYALDRVLAHARAHPQRRVLIKLRARPGDQTTHIERHHFAKLAHRRDVPANVHFLYGPMAAVLDETDLCVTVSSTAALEALQRGIPTAVLTDFGIRESLGNHVFLNSGLFTSWSALDAGVTPVPDPDWLAANGVGDPEPYTLLRERVGKMVAEKALLAPLLPWYDGDSAAGYLPALLARHDLAPDGAPLADIDPGDPTASPGRRLARRSARAVYQFGVNSVAPPLRRLAQQ